MPVRFIISMYQFQKQGGLISMELRKEWDLSVLYSSFDDEKFSADFEKLKEKIKEVNAWVDENLQDPGDAAKKIERIVEINNEMSYFDSLYAFVNLTLSTDVSNEKAAKLDDMISSTYNGMTRARTLFSEFIGKCENLEEAIQSSELLAKHAFVLREIRAKSKYNLSKEEEVLLARVRQNGSDMFSTLQSQLTATLMIDIEMNGETKKLPLAAVREMSAEPDAALRKHAYEQELAAYPRIERSIAMALNSIKGDANLFAEIRGYDSPLDMTLKNQRLEPEILDTMLDVMREAMPHIRKYYKKKAEMLGHKNGLPWYDVYAPVGTANLRYTYEEAADFIVKNFNDFTPDLGTFARRAFDEAWIDVLPKEGKVGGAFCAGLSPQKMSRILTNFIGSYSDITTLAHELGHAYHNECLKDETRMNSRFTSPIAESASNFGETIVENAALKSATKEEALVILDCNLTSNAQVIIDIYSRYLFETEVIARRKNGPLSVKEFKEIMLWAQKEAYGDGLDPDYLHPYMWICKSHYYGASHNFYNFPYAYGLLFAKGLYAIFLEEGESFVPKYRKLLSVTGKQTLKEVGETAGINLLDKEFWRKSIKVVTDRVDEFCAY